VSTRGAGRNGAGGNGAGGRSAERLVGRLLALLLFLLALLERLHATFGLATLADIALECSTAGHVVYEGGGGYTAAKHAQHALTGTLRLELSGRPIRVIEIEPGMVRTDEFALVRLPFRPLEVGKSCRIRQNLTSTPACTRG